MCGVAGLLRLDGAPASRDEAAAMAAAMAHRGPDGRGAWADGPVALAHVRLAVRDRGPAAAQPMVAPGGEGVLVYNGEAYGEGPLRDELVRGGAPIRGTGDAEVVLHACARFGAEAAARRLDGMFAFAWWDARERALWLVRDRFGIKPLHVALEPGRVLFASEVRGLRVLGAGRRPDRIELVRRLLPWRADVRRPVFADVENVGPGEAWRLDARRVERRTWCDVTGEVDPARIVAAGAERPDAWVERVGAVVARAVDAHLVSDAPVAAFASSGLDSNLVCALARERRPDLVAYTLDTEHPESEAADALRIARHTGVEVRTVRMGREAHLRAWPEAIDRLEHPHGHPSQPEMLALCRAARADGFVVVLTGEGADELFGGYRFFEHTWDRWRRATSWWSRLTRRSRERTEPLVEAPFDYQMTRRTADVHARVGLFLAPAEEPRARALMERLRPVEPVADRAFLAHGLDSLRRHLDAILLRHDRLGMAASLELRVPFLSRDVADVALHLPRRAKLHRGVGKWALRAAAGDRLPPLARHGRKKGFPVPASHHRGTSALLRGGVVPELFRWPRAAEDDLVERVERDPVLRHQVTALEIWGRLFVRGEPPAEVAERLVAAAGPA
jgi:asparagine synthase (glutamine-hydrolysing)